MSPQLPPGAVLDEDSQLPPGAILEPTYTNPAPVGVRPDPEAEHRLDVSAGIPLYQVAPGKPQKELPPMSFGEALITNPAKQIASGLMSSAAGATGLTGNVAHLLDTAATKISGLTGLEKGGLFKQIEDWAKQQQTAQQQEAGELRGGRDDLASRLYNLAGSTAGSLPTYAVAAELGGPVIGMGALGALETADQGPANMTKAALENAATGGALTVMGPASRPIRLMGAGAMTYAQLRLQGVDHETALANAMTMGGLSATHPGGATTGEILRNLPVPETTIIPPLFRNPNRAQREAMDWYKNQGVSVSAPAASGSRFLGGLQRAAEATPFGAMIGEGSRQETAEGVRRLSGQLEKQATPETPPGEFYQRFYDAEENASPESVPTGESDAQGRPVFTNMQMPVPVGVLKSALKPIFEQMQWMPMADRNTSAGYTAIKRILEGPEFIPASQAETGLSGIKSMIRDSDGRNRGIAKKIAPQLQGLIDRTVQRSGGDEPMEALQNGRKAAAKQAGADWLKEGFDKARAEGEFNRQDFLWNRWLNLPEEARRTMFSPKQVSDLNHFFLGAKNLFKNVNPSGTAQVSAIAHLLTFPAHPIEVSSSLLGGAAIAKLLNSERGVKLLTEGLKVGGNTARGREIQSQLTNIIGTPPEESPEGQPPTGGGTPPNPPPSPPGSTGGAAPTETPSVGEKVKGAVKKFWEDEEGSAKIPEWIPGRTKLADINADYVVPAEGKRLVKEDVMRYLEGQVEKHLGAIPPNAPPKFKLQRLLKLGRSEMRDQLNQPDPKLDFYLLDTPQAKADYVQMFPEVATDSTRMTLLQAASAALAQGSNPEAEAMNGGRAYAYYRQHGKLPFVQPNDGIPGQNPGKQWSTTAGSDPIIKLQGFIDSFKSKQDPTGLVELQRILTGWYPVGYLRHFNKNVEGPAGEFVPGALILGPKIGSYFMDISGIPQKGATVDMWDTLAHHRRMGYLFTDAGEPITAPTLKSDRAIFQDFHTKLEDEFNLKRTQSQSGLWHYEKDLYRLLGIPTPVKGRSDGTKRLLDAWGFQRQNVITPQNAPPPPSRANYVPPQVP